MSYHRGKQSLALQEKINCYVIMNLTDFSPKLNKPTLLLNIFGWQILIFLLCELVAKLYQGTK